jgi:SAM-dependent methyltransferase
MERPNVSLDDPTSIQDYLASFDIFAGNEAEGVEYLRHSLRRILLTLALTPPSPETGGRLLELGANPYFLTLLLAKFTRYELTLANYFGKWGPVDGHGTQVVSNQRYGETHEFGYDHFNGEQDCFPYPDHTFDVVLNCEILEHLPLDPTHFLCECHRILKPGGSLLLTTPNVLSLENLWHLMWRKNIYDLYSGYGVYGRHNREYTPAEVVDLLRACGFGVTRLELADIFPHPVWARLLKRLRPSWRDNIFVLAQAQGRPRYTYPTWLYRSMVSLRRIVRSDVVMGENDLVQLGAGWSPLEASPTPARRIKDKSWAYLLNPGQVHQLGLQVNAMAKTLGGTVLTIQVESARAQFALDSNDWEELYMELPPDLPREVEVVLSASPTGKPAEQELGQADEKSGVLIKRLWLQ